MDISFTCYGNTNTLYLVHRSWCSKFEGSGETQVGMIEVAEGRKGYQGAQELEAADHLHVNVQ